MSDTHFEFMPGCYFRVPGRAPVWIPVVRIVETAEKRVAARRRVYKNGAKLDPTGREPLIWTVEAIYFNGSDEPNIPREGNYPGEANRLCDAINVEDTGDLQLPTRGVVRAQFKGYERTEDPGAIDAATVRLTFWEDSEDDTTLASFAAPSGRAISRALADRAVLTVSEAGAWSSDLAELHTLAASLETMAASPFEYGETFQARVQLVLHKVQAVERTFASTHNRAVGEVAKLLTKPEASKAGLALVALAVTTALLGASVAGAGEIITRTFGSELSIFDIATTLGQDSMKLCNLNTGIPDLLAIRPGTPVRVFRTYEAAS